MTNNVFLKDDEIMHLADRKDLSEYLDFRKIHDTWVEPYTFECAAVGIENHPLFLDQELDKANVTNNDAAKECVAETGLFLSFPFHGKRVVYPTRDTSLTGVYARAGLSGSTITGYDEKRNMKPLPIIEKASWLSRGMSLYSNKCKVLVRDEKVSSCLSNEYTIMPADELVGLVEKELDKASNTYEFYEGNVDHTYLHVQWVLNDAIADASFKMMLKKLGIAGKEVKCAIGFATSDVGASRAYAYPFALVDGKPFYFSKGRGSEHKGEAMEAFKAAISGVCDLFSEAEDKIEALGNTDIKDVRAVVERIVNENAMFPKKQSKGVLDSLPIGAGTAIDCYLALSDIIREVSLGASPERQLNLMEKLVSFLTFDYKGMEV